MTSWWAVDGRGLRIGGHRGDPSRAPENTLAAIALATDAGVDYVELDTHLARDGVLVVIHDAELGRTTDARGRVADLTSTELASLDAGSWFDPRFQGVRVPLLAEVLAQLETVRSPAGRAVAAMVEAKGPGTGGPLARALGASSFRQRLAICSSAPDELSEAREADASIATMLIVDRDRRDIDPALAAAACGAAMVNVPAGWLAAADVARLHRHGLLVAGGTGDDAATIGHAMAIGLDAIDSNVPAAAVAWRDADARSPETGPARRSMKGIPALGSPRSSVPGSTDVPP